MIVTAATVRDLGFESASENLSENGFYVCCSLNWQTRPIIRVNCSPFPPTSLHPSVYPRGWFNKAQLSEVFKMWFLYAHVGLQPAATYVRHHGDCDFQSIRVCQANTMQQNSPVKVAVHKKRKHFQVDGLIATDARWLPSFSVKLFVSLH